MLLAANGDGLPHVSLTERTQRLKNAFPAFFPQAKNLFARAEFQAGGLKFGIAITSRFFAVTVGKSVQREIMLPERCCTITAIEFISGPTTA